MFTVKIVKNVCYLLTNDFGETNHIYCKKTKDYTGLCETLKNSIDRMAVSIPACAFNQKLKLK